MDFNLNIWRQASRDAQGRMVTYQITGIGADTSFLEMLDLLNEQLQKKGEEPVAFDSDCREGICGTCSLVVNGRPHGQKGTTACQLHMRSFTDGDAITIEPWRAQAFPVLRDLVVDRSAFDRIMQAGGFVSVRTGGAPDANAVLVKKEEADQAFDAAACIGCGACVAACRNAAPMLFVGAKVSQYMHLPQGQPERERRVVSMVEAMEKEGFGACTNYFDCEAVCPKEISVKVIAEFNREYLRATLVSQPATRRTAGDG